ncbi:hypothetical protein HPB51_010080 [Rhipicephalus microplus]|uniref:Cytochrome n=1 Tax=Rhipicephalus microplus TaxID=6941 RepID=A0A9J6F1H6_RHIMP|nr:hypothetical protein HPB51_010080 [Rhipicephalus microplus]
MFPSRLPIETGICFYGSRPPAYGDREKLPFTIACLLETLRMHPATPLGIPHNTTTDTRVGKWDIPKDTGMLYNIYAVHHDPKNWEEPEEFRPERFLDPVTGKVCTDVGPLITFGQGARSCPGEKLAKMDVFYIFVRLVQRLTEEHSKHTIRYHSAARTPKKPRKKGFVTQQQVGLATLRLRDGGPRRKGLAVEQTQSCGPVKQKRSRSTVKQTHYVFL